MPSRQSCGDCGSIDTVCRWGELVARREHTRRHGCRWGLATDLIVRWRLEDPVSGASWGPPTLTNTHTQYPTPPLWAILGSHPMHTSCFKMAPSLPPSLPPHPYIKQRQQQPLSLHKNIYLIFACYIQKGRYFRF